MTELRRAFLALWLPEPLAEGLSARVAGLTGRGFLPVDLHLTLAFLGDLDARQVHEIGVLAAELHLPAAGLAFDRIEYWPHNRILWAHPATWPAPLADFVDQLHARLRASGFVLEERAFRPHVSLLRQAPRPQAGSLPALDDLPVWPVDGWCLAGAHAQRSAATPRYACVTRWPALRA